MVNELKKAIYFPSAHVNGKAATKPKPAFTSGSPKSIYIPAAVNAKPDPKSKPAAARKKSPVLSPAFVSGKPAAAKPKPVRGKLTEPKYGYAKVKDFRAFLAATNPKHEFANDIVAAAVEAGRMDFTGIGHMLGSNQGRRYERFYKRYLEQSNIQDALKPSQKVSIKPRSPTKKKQPISFRKYLEENNSKFTGTNEMVADAVEAGVTDMVTAFTEILGKQQAQKYNEKYEGWLKAAF